MKRSCYNTKSTNARIPLKVSVTIVIVLLSILTIYMWIQPKEFKVSDDEIALYIQLDTKEDIGLLVFDYSVNGTKYSGGTGNADKSLLKHDELLIEVWNQESLNCFVDTVELYIQFRIITEYADPNYENIYPENITKNMDPISFEANFGESYYFTITGDNINGYTIVQNYSTNKTHITAVQPTVLPAQTDGLKSIILCAIMQKEIKYEYI